MGQSRRIMYRAMGLNLSRIGLNRILEISDKRCSYYVHPKWIQSSIYRKWCRFLFTRKFLHLKISVCSEQLLRWCISTSLQTSSKNFQSQFHLELLYFFWDRCDHIRTNLSFLTCQRTYTRNATHKGISEIFRVIWPRTNIA